MFRKLIRERRCLIPVNCYYEWKETPTGKRPYCIRMADESPFFLGGMWEVWRAREPEALFTFTVLTALPNEVSGMVHDRMPVIVQTKDPSAVARSGELRRCGHPGDPTIRRVDRLSGEPACQQPEE